MEQFPTNQENKESIVNNALEIARDMAESYEDLIVQVKELADKNEALKEALQKYDNNLELFEDFGVSTRSGFKQPIFSVENGADRLVKYLENNKQYAISTEQLKEVKENLESRKQIIIEALSKDFADKKEATEEIKKIHTEQILPALSSAPIVTER